MKNEIQKYIKESIKTKEEILNSEAVQNAVESAVNIIVEAYKNDKKVLFAGNGGSAADAQHLAAELVSKFNLDRPALNAIALTTNTSILTAVGNDYSHEYVFPRQIHAYGVKDDVFVAISTSGNSKNIINSIGEAKRRGLKVIGLTGKNPCLMDNLCDCIIKVPSADTPIVQEAHIMLGHIICGLVEEKLFA